MADFYSDSSALVKRYISETGSAWITGLFDPSLSHELSWLLRSPQWR